MSRRQFKAQAKSGRAGDSFGAFGSSGFGAGQSSVLSYIQEPPNYSAITDTNLVVAFKNLSKKDEKTKAKGLDDLQLHLSAEGVEIEDGFLEAWTQLFPRLTIDNSRRVRQTTHALNGQVCTISGKRVAKYLPRIAGPWLAGTFDSDRMVSKAATTALALVFPTAEKINGLRKTFQRSILEYARDAALYETIQSLSDERGTNADDAQAIYARVVAGGVALINSLLIELPTEAVASENELYEQILQDGNLWEFVTYPEPTVRRSTHRLLQTCLQRMSEPLQQNIKAVSNAYIYKGLHSNQEGSVLDFLKTLEALTTAMPTIWTVEYTGKKSATSRLRSFLKQGSQSGSNAFWESLNRLLPRIPLEILPKTAKDIEEFLTAARSGVSQKEERFHASAAWSTYFLLADLLTSPLAQTDADPIVETQLLPLIRQYVFPEQETADWTISGGKVASVVSGVVTVQRVIVPLSNLWLQLSENLLEAAQLSQPEQSKDFDKSQKHVATTGERWSDFQREAWIRQPDEELPSAFIAASNKVLRGCIDLLKARNAKPYGAAAIIEQLLRACGQHLMEDADFAQTYFAFATGDLPRVIFSPSQRHLIHSLYAVSSQPQFSDAIEGLLNGILDAQESEELKIIALRAVFVTGAPGKVCQLAKKNERLQNLLVEAISTPGSSNATDLFIEVSNFGAASQSTIDAVLSELTATLMHGEQTESVLPTIEALYRTDEVIVNAFSSQPSGTGRQLLPNLLRLEQGADPEVAVKAAALSARLASSANFSSRDKYDIVRQNLSQASPTSLPIVSVLELAFRLMNAEKKVESEDGNILPDGKAWIDSLVSTIRPPKPALALLSPLGGAVNLLDRSVKPNKAVQFDEEGFSPALRMAMYTAKILTETNWLEVLGRGTGSAMTSGVLATLHVAALAAEDNVSLRGTNDVFRASIDEHGELVVLDFISEANKVLNKYWSTVVPDGLDEELAQLSVALENIRGSKEDVSSPVAYYTWLCYANTLANLFEIHGHTQAHAEESEKDLKQQREEEKILPLIVLIAGKSQPLTGSQALSRFGNELVSDLTALDFGSQGQQGPEKLILLNTILHTQEDMAPAISKQRLVFLVKALIRCLDESSPLAIRVEVCKALSELLTAMQDMYGEHWDQVISFLISCWSSPPATESNEGNSILLMNASLKLFSALTKMSKSEEPNDDLVDTLKDKADQIRDGLINLLMVAGGAEDDTNQPLLITHELLARQIAALPPKPLKQAEDIYPLLNSQSRPIMQAAFDMLHADIPVAQEQISFDAALDDKSARLPDELLSLVLEPPTLDSLAEASFDRMMPLSLQGYLYSWRLLFDHFNGSSFRVQTDYIEQLKEGGYLPALLDFTFDFLGHTRGKPVDVSKFEIATYTADVEPTPEKDVQWLLTHLYFLALTHVPSLVRSYYLDIRSRQTSLAVETWTAKYLSPLVIAASLQSVAVWAEKSVKEDPEYEKMTIKVGMRSKEINVNYVVDEQTMAIKVVLPDAYPLASASVQSVNRVAAKEVQWQSWLRNCQGVITFSNGSIIDGLTAWRKNVTGALKGQTECAICYSIISADKQLPTKRCPTCKHLFHASCLFKWFKTSNASTCPLCRNPFNFN